MQVQSAKVAPQLPRYQEYYIRRNPDQLSAEELAKQFGITVAEVSELWRVEDQEQRRRAYLAENDYTADLSQYVAEMYAEEPTRKAMQRFRAGDDRVSWLVNEGS